MQLLVEGALVSWHFKLPLLLSLGLALDLGNGTDFYIHWGFLHVHCLSFFVLSFLKTHREKKLWALLIHKSNQHRWQQRNFSFPFLKMFSNDV